MMARPIDVLLIGVYCGVVGTLAYKAWRAMEDRVQELEWKTLGPCPAIGAIGEEAGEGNAEAD